MHSVAGVQPVGVSPILLSVRVLIPLINSAITPEECRTLVVYHHNDTADVATEIFQTVGDIKAPFVSINIDIANTVPQKITDIGMGSHLFNICVMKDIDMSTPQYQQTLALLDRQSKNQYFMVIQQIASQREINAFFKSMWTEYRMLSVAAFFLGDFIQAYTHFPYKNRFAVKLDEFNASNTPPAGKSWFRKYFIGKENDLDNAKINVYTSENMPKAFRIPSKYRHRHNHFYFGGRDGFVAMTLESVMNVQWQYKSLDDSQVTKIADMMANDGRSTDMYGIPTDFDDRMPPNLEYRTLGDGEPIT